MNTIINYTNWKDETEDRYIIPIRIYFGSTTNYNEQWLLEAVDLEREVVKIFRMCNIHKWERAITI